LLNNETPHYNRLLAKDKQRQEIIQDLQTVKKKDLFPPLSKEALEKVAWAMGEGDDLVVYEFAVKVTKADMRTLR
jgi:hypothetical protein